MNLFEKREKNHFSYQLHQKDKICNWVIKTFTIHTLEPFTKV